MNDALRTIELPPEALALIREGRPTPQAVEPLVAAPSVLEVPPKNERTKEPKPEEPSEKPRKRTTEPETPVRSLSRSFRVPENLLIALLRASTERRIAREAPFTQEEMVTEAIREWLTKNKLL